MKIIATRLRVSQAASGMVSGIFLPFFAAWLAWRGLPAAQIGLLLSLSLVLRAFTGPASGIIADARDDRRAAMLVLYWAMLVGFGALTVVKNPVVIFLCAVPAYVAFGSATPLLESVSVRLAERYGFDYGRVRLWASSSFVAMNVMGGLCVGWFGIRIVAPILAATAALCVLTTSMLPAPGTRQPHGDLLPRLKATWSETRELLRAGVFLVFLLAASFEQASHAFYYAYGGLHWRALGYSGPLIGVLWPIGVFAEIALFSQALRAQRVIGPVRLLWLGGLAAIVRWTILAFDPPLWIVVAAQLLHGATFAMAHLGAMFFILRAVPPRLAATAQSLYFVCSQGLAMGIATYGAGWIYAGYGGRAYLMMSAMGLISMGLSLMLAKRWQGGRILWGDEAHSDSI